MDSMQARVKWLDGVVFVGESGSGHAIVMDGARIGARSIVAAGAVVTRDTVVPPGSLYVGSPARSVRQLSQQEQLAIRGWAEKYIKVSQEHREALAGA